MKIHFNEIGCDWTIVASVDTENNPDIEQAVRDLVDELTLALQVYGLTAKEPITIEE